MNPVSNIIVDSEAAFDLAQRKGYKVKTELVGASGDTYSIITTNGKEYHEAMAAAMNSLHQLDKVETARRRLKEKLMKKKALK